MASRVTFCLVSTTPAAACAQGAPPAALSPPAPISSTLTVEAAAPTSAVASSDHAASAPSIVAAEDAKGVNPRITLKSLESSVAFIAKKSEKSRNATLNNLIEQQQKQLSDLRNRYSAGSTISADEFQASFRSFFDSGNELRQMLMQQEHAPKATEYSPDPSQCANHCSQTCGYNSIGEKVCWYTCYYCCGHGGC
jgi:hypothetical protein